MSNQVCRLCLAEKDLVWIFDKKVKFKLKVMILAMWKVEICRTDAVSQMVCSTCCQLTIKMFKFRTTSIKNDKDLKARCAGYNISQLTNAAANHRKEDTPAPPPPPPTPPTAPSPQITIKPVAPQNKNLHPSVRKVMNQFPNIKLPQECLKSHIGAYITLMTEEVDEWYQERNYSDAEIAKIKKAAVKALKKKPARKRKISTDEKDSIKPVKLSKRVRLSSDRSDDSVTVATPKTAKSVAKERGSKSARKVETPVITKSDEPSIKKSDSDSLPVKCVLPKAESTLKALLENKDKDKKKSDKEEITLTSILQSNETLNPSDDDDNVDIVTIDDDYPPSPKEPEKSKEESDKKEEKDGNGIVTEEDFELFTSRPFITDNPEEQTPKPKSKVINDEPIVLDDDDDETSRTSSATSKSSDVGKNSFAQALQLKPSESNQPDLSLVSLANKSYTLYTCKVCDSQHSSLKDLKHHERKTHTKCPFCRKRFRSLASRDEHVATSCSISRSSMQLKHMRLQLVRVDEDEEVRKKYASAFDLEEKEEEKTEEAAPPERTIADCDPATVDAINELEQFLNCADVVTVKDKNAEKPDEGRGDDVICISDEEAESGKPAKESRRINVVNSEILANINIHDNDVNVLKRILTQARIKSAINEQNGWSLENSPIVDGSSSRVKIFKNLRRHLNRYKIPIEVKYSPTVTVEYRPTTRPFVRKVHDLWHALKPIELKPIIAPKSQYAILNGQMPVSKPAPTTAPNTLAKMLLAPSNTSMVLTSTTNTSSSYTNFILVPNSVLSSRPTVISTAAAVLPPPAAVLPNTPPPAVLAPTSPPPLAVISSVTSEATEQPSISKVAQLESITNALMPPPGESVQSSDGGVANFVISSVSSVQTTESEAPTTTTAEVAAPQPSIRVKNLQELS